LTTVRTDFDVEIPEWKYKIWLKYFAPKVENLQAGGYRVDVPMTLENVFTKVLMKPVYTDLTITILPGWNSYDIDDYLYRKDIIENPGDFLLALRDNFSKYKTEYSFLDGVMSVE
jgi:cell division protein YceG involved in septum cleavage